MLVKETSKNDDIWQRKLKKLEGRNESSLGLIDGAWCNHFCKILMEGLENCFVDKVRRYACQSFWISNEVFIFIKQSIKEK